MNCLKQAQISFKFISKIKETEAQNCRKLKFPTTEYVDVKVESDDDDETSCSSFYGEKDRLQPEVDFKQEDEEMPAVQKTAKKPPTFVKTSKQPPPAPKPNIKPVKRIAHKIEKFTCVYCKQSYENFGALYAHLISKVCHAVQCNKCHEGFASEKLLEQHRMEKHGKIKRIYNRQKYCKKCEECDEEFGDPMKFMLHVETSHRRKKENAASSSKVKSKAKS